MASSGMSSKLQGYSNRECKTLRACQELAITLLRRQFQHQSPRTQHTSALHSKDTCCKVRWMICGCVALQVHILLKLVPDKIHASRYAVRLLLLGALLSILKFRSMVWAH